MSKKIAFVTGHSKPSEMSTFEKILKQQYLTGPEDQRPCLTFFHQNMSEVDIAVKVKDKKPVMLIFDGVAQGRVVTVQKAVHKRMNGNSPEMLQIGNLSLTSGVRSVLSHEKIREMIQN